MATVNINASKQTWASSGTQSTFSAARNATSSNTHTNYTSQANKTTAISEFWSSGRGGGAATITRSFFFFDTSTVNGTITAIGLQIYNNGPINAGNAVRVAKSTAFGGDGNTAYANTDFDNWASLNTVPNPSEPIPYSDSNYTWTGGLNNVPAATNTISLNSTAISNANSNSYLNLVLVGGSYDYVNNSPLSNIELNSQIQFASTTVFPRLSITYIPAVSGITTVSSVIGVEAANISSINSI